jgi:hypothetical protein
VTNPANSAEHTGYAMIKNPFRPASRLSLPPQRSDEALDNFCGASFLEQEPDLAKEAGQYTLDASGWAMSGHPIGD